jgi:hypothetical protein
MAQLGNRVGWGIGRYSARAHPFLQQTSGQIFEDDENGFSSTSVISLQHEPYIE